ncbi:MAG: hypothetical protein R2879_22715, partial [Saprospiraceae bacterium]
MKIVNHSMSFWLIMLLCTICNYSSFANNIEWECLAVDTSLTCNDLVQVSLDENCEAVIIPDMILEGIEGSLNEFSVELLDEVGLPVLMPVNEAHIGDTLYVIVIHNQTGNSCWGRALIEDKWAPSITCNNHFAQCFESPNGFPRPKATDNCDAFPSVALLSQNIDDSDKCNEVTITSTYVAIDQSGNESTPCIQTVTLTPPLLPSFPSDTVWSCEVYKAHPNIINPKKIAGNLNSTGSGVPDVSLSNNCPYSVVHSDFVFNTDCGETFTIRRTWTVLNWCTDEIITIGSNNEDNVQFIKVEDQNPPIIDRPPFTVNANIGSASNEDCGSTDFLLPPVFVDDCNDVTVRILTGVGEAIYINGDGSQGGYIPYPGLPLGVHTILYEAIDACNNVDTAEVSVTVADQTRPTTICDELTNVSLGIDGKTSVAAFVFDDGSYDNCCLDKFMVRRMESQCMATDTLFQDSIFFCCYDVGDTVQVVFQAIDCAGNTNECMVLVEVEEKLPPYLVSCPAPEIIGCDFFANYLEIPLAEGNDSVLLQFGEPVFEDNCDLVFIENSVVVDLDQCLQGTITRRWRVTDQGQNPPASCTQIIEVEHISDWLVLFPEDQNIECGEAFPDTGEPTIFFENCEMIAISFVDEVFTVVPNVCFKIARNWTVINWCTVGDEIDNPLIESAELDLSFDLNYDQILSDRLFKDGVNTANFNTQTTQFGAQPDGVVVFQQEISVIDNVDPVVICEPLLDICIEDTVCFTDVMLPVPNILDCGIELTISAIGELGTGLGPFTDVPPGIYLMTYQVDDNCGNRGFCETKIEVRDCKKPTPVCDNGLIIEIDEDSIVIVNAEIFNGGSYDNCPGELMFSFSIDPTDSLAIFDCSSIGYQNVDIWLTDAAGNQDFCANFVFVQDNDGVCSGLPLISGIVQTAENKALVDVELANNALPISFSDTTGRYSFEASLGEDLTISAAKNSFPLNGITTFDIVLINKHILGVQSLDSPYKIIAADANLSNSITTYDLVLLRKLILQVNTEFPHG